MNQRTAQSRAKSCPKPHTTYGPVNSMNDHESYRPSKLSANRVVALTCGCRSSSSHEAAWPWWGRRCQVPPWLRWFRLRCPPGYNPRDRSTQARSDHCPACRVPPSVAHHRFVGKVSAQHSNGQTFWHITEGHEQTPAPIHKSRQWLPNPCNGAPQVSECARRQLRQIVALGPGINSLLCKPANIAFLADRSALKRCCTNNRRPRSETPSCCKTNGMAE